MHNIAFFITNTETKSYRKYCKNHAYPQEVKNKKTPCHRVTQWGRYLKNSQNMMVWLGDFTTFEKIQTKS